jgi:hypothetical protein
MHIITENVCKWIVRMTANYDVVDDYDEETGDDDEHVKMILK